MDNTAVIEQIKAIFADSTPKAYVRSFGCQQSVSDGEKIKGLLSLMGCTFTEDETQADIIMLNTCAVRENAEDRSEPCCGKDKEVLSAGGYRHGYVGYKRTSSSSS